MSSTRRSSAAAARARSVPRTRSRGSPTHSPDSKALDWLLEKDQPSMRYRTLTELLGRKETDREVQEAHRAILETGWAAEILAQRDSTGGWGDGKTQYRPKYQSTNWKMLVLSDLGLTRADPGIDDACERWMQGFAASEGRLGGSAKGNPHYCVSANLARALIRFGYADDPRVRRTLEWFVETASPKGGWSCWGSGRNLDSWEALSAFAVYPRSMWTPAMETCMAKATEFYLERELHRQGPRYAPWYRFHYPVHYYYDLLVGLDFMTALGYAGDPRMEYAVRYLRSRRDENGLWNLDAVHPDVKGPMAEWFANRPSHRPSPFALEKVHQPSKMITFRALKVLAAVDQAVPSSKTEP